MAERPYIVGNWKMNGTRAMLSQARAIDRAAQNLMKVEVALAPTPLVIATAREGLVHPVVAALDLSRSARGREILRGWIRVSDDIGNHGVRAAWQ